MLVYVACMGAAGRHIRERYKANHSLLGVEEAFVLGYNVERLRKGADLDIKEFAQIAGVSRPTVYKVERGESDLKLSCICKFAKALGVSVSELLALPPDFVASLENR